MNVRQLIERLQTLDPDDRIILSAKDCTVDEECDLDFYHKGEISNISFHCMDDLTTGAYVIESDNTFLEGVRKVGADNGKVY